MLRLKLEQNPVSFHWRESIPYMKISYNRFCFVKEVLFYINYYILTDIMFICKYLTSSLILSFIGYYKTPTLHIKSLFEVQHVLFRTPTQH